MDEALFGSLEFFHTLLDAMPAMLLVVDADLMVRHVNASARLICDGISDVSMRSGGEVLNCVRAAEAAEGCGRSQVCEGCVIGKSVAEAMQGKQTFREPARLHLKTQNGVREFHFRITTTPFQYGINQYALLAVENVSGLKDAERALRAGEAKLRNITGQLGEGVYALDQEGALTFLNPEGERLLGWTEAELIGRKVHEVIHKQKMDGTRLSSADCPVRKAIDFACLHRVDEDVFTRKDGALVPVSITARPLLDHGRVVGAVAVFRDITEQTAAADELKRLNELLARQSRNDTLTGIANRLQFEETMNAEMLRSRRHGLTFSIIMFDIDRFRELNETFGRHSGDAVLWEIAGMVARSIRAHDLFARWGGEEFAILVTNSSLESVLIFAEKLRLMIAGHDFPMTGRVTCSFGAAEFGSDDTDEALLRRAESALCRAKESGRNRVETA